MSARAAAWLGWSLCGLSVVLAAAAGLLAYVSYSVQSASESVGVGAMFGLALLAYPVVGALVVSRRPENSVGWMFCVVGIFGALQAVSREYATYVTLTRSDPLSMAAYAAWLENWAWIPPSFLVLAGLPLLFPHGRLPSRRWRPVIWLSAAAMVALVINKAFMPGPFDNYPSLRNPFGAEGAERLLRPLFHWGNLLLLVVTLAAVAAVLVRLRYARGSERLQLKWFIYAVVAMVAVMTTSVIAAGLLRKEPVDVAYVPMIASMAALPVATGIAILKYRLYDIDILVNRTLVYGTLTVALAAVYIGGVVSLQALFRALTDQGSQLAIVASTLAIAALFNPLRRRIQSFIDRRFYRKKYDARKTLEAFSIRLRDETDLETLYGELAGVVRDTMQPEYVSVWLRPGVALKGERAD